MGCCVCLCRLQAKLLNGKTNKEESATDGDNRNQLHGAKKKNKDHDPLIFVSARGGAYVGDLDRAISIAG